MPISWEFLNGEENSEARVYFSALLETWFPPPELAQFVVNALDGPHVPVSLAWIGSGAAVDLQFDTAIDDVQSVGYTRNLLNDPDQVLFGKPPHDTFVADFLLPVIV